jgi:hypothetical protein
VETSNVEGGFLVVYSGVQTGMSLPTFERSLLPFIALMMEAVRTSDTLLNSCQSARRYNPQENRLHTHRRENLK